MVALINSDTGILLDHLHPLSLFHLPSLRTSQVGRPTVVLGSVAGRGIFKFLLPLDSNLFCSWFCGRRSCPPPPTPPAPVFSCLTLRSRKTQPKCGALFLGQFSFCFCFFGRRAGLSWRGARRACASVCSVVNQYSRLVVKRRTALVLDSLSSATGSTSRSSHRLPAVPPASLSGVQVALSSF